MKAVNSKDKKSGQGKEVTRGRKAGIQNGATSHTTRSTTQSNSSLNGLPPEYFKNAISGMKVSTSKVLKHFEEPNTKTSRYHTTAKELYSSSSKDFGHGCYRPSVLKEPEANRRNGWGRIFCFLPSLSNTFPEYQDECRDDEIINNELPEGLAKQTLHLPIFQQEELNKADDGTKHRQRHPSKKVDDDENRSPPPPQSKVFSIQAVEVDNRNNDVDQVIIVDDDAENSNKVNDQEQSNHQTNHPKPFKFDGSGPVTVRVSSSIFDLSKQNSTSCGTKGARQNQNEEKSAGETTSEGSNISSSSRENSTNSLFSGITENDDVGPNQPDEKCSQDSTHNPSNNNTTHEMFLKSSRFGGCSERNSRTCTKSNIIQSVNNDITQHSRQTTCTAITTDILLEPLGILPNEERLLISTPHDITSPKKSKFPQQAQREPAVGQVADEGEYVVFSQYFGEQFVWSESMDSSYIPDERRIQVPEEIVVLHDDGKEALSSQDSASELFSDDELKSFIGEDTMESIIGEDGEISSDIHSTVPSTTTRNSALMDVNHTKQAVPTTQPIPASQIVSTTKPVSTRPPVPSLRPVSPEKHIVPKDKRYNVSIQESRSDSSCDNPFKRSPHLVSNKQNSKDTSSNRKRVFSQDSKATIQCSFSNDIDLDLLFQGSGIVHEPMISNEGENRQLAILKTDSGRIHSESPFPSNLAAILNADDESSQDSQDSGFVMQIQESASSDELAVDNPFEGLRKPANVPDWLKNKNISDRCHTLGPMSDTISDSCSKSSDNSSTNGAMKEIVNYQGKNTASKRKPRRTPEMLFSRMKVITDRQQLKVKQAPESGNSNTFCPTISKRIVSPTNSVKQQKHARTIAQLHQRSLFAKRFNTPIIDSDSENDDEMSHDDDEKISTTTQSMASKLRADRLKAAKEAYKLKEASIRSLPRSTILSAWV